MRNPEFFFISQSYSRHNIFSFRRFPHRSWLKAFMVTNGYYRRPSKPRSVI